MKMEAVAKAFLAGREAEAGNVRSYTRDNCTFYSSFGTVIAVRDAEGQVYVTTKHYSMSTSRHRNCVAAPGSKRVTWVEKIPQELETQGSLTWTWEAPQT